MNKIKNSFVWELYLLFAQISKFAFAMYKAVDLIGQKILLELYHYLFQINLIWEEILNKTNAKIDVEAVRDYQSRSYKHIYMRNNPEEMVKALDISKMLQSLLSKDVPAERSNNAFNLFFALGYPNATSEEIESALVSIRDNGNTKLNSFYSGLKREFNDDFSRDTCMELRPLRHQN